MRPQELVHAIATPLYSYILCNVAHCDQHIRSSANTKHYSTTASNTNSRDSGSCSGSESGMFTNSSV
jgi:hypothetical protein